VTISDKEWVDLMAAIFGRKTIDEVRADVGLPGVRGGDIAYVDWLKQMAGLPLRPELRVVPYD
jgi:hypothetical protein